MENKNIGITIIALALLVSIGVNIMPEDNYYCEDRNIAYHCDGFSQYYSLPTGKCINELVSNKLCRTGWVEIDRTPSIDNYTQEAQIPNSSEGIESNGYRHE